MDLEEVFGQIYKLYEEFSKKYGKKLQIQIEPGKYFVSDTTFLLTTVTAIKKTEF